MADEERKDERKTIMAPPRRRPSRGSGNGRPPAPRPAAAAAANTSESKSENRSKSAPGQDAQKQSAPKQSAPKQGAQKQSAPKQGSPKQGAQKQSAPKQSAPKQGSPKQGEQKQSAPKQGGQRQGAPRQGGQSGNRGRKGVADKAAPAAINGKIRIIPLGGLGEVGKNLTVIEFDEKMIIIDCGMTFPDDDMLGIDYVIPDTTFLTQNRDKLLGIFLTHGHEDHIGALPYVVRDLKLPVYGTRLTLGILYNKLREHRLEKSTKLIEISAGQHISCPPFDVEFIAVNHSIADAVALAITTPVGVLVHTGDFKVDMTPIMGDPIDLTRFGELGKAGVLCLMSESTNAERPGLATSERHVGESFESIFSKNKDRRIIVASFASNVSRVQQVINAAVHADRKVAVSGRSMINVLTVARQLGYMNIPDGTLVELDEISKYPPERMVIITTGSQGEPMSALYRMAYSDHKKVEIGARDTVIISASPIPGNEKLVYRVINELLKSGAEVVHSPSADVHVSGHACQEELSIMLSLVRPKYFLPVHGEYRMQKRHAQLAEATGVAPYNTFILENGSVFEFDRSAAKVVGKVPAGKVLVDGLGVGDVGSIVLRDRRHLAQDGLIVVVATVDGESNELVSGPDLISRGFVYVRESGDMMEQARLVVRDMFTRCATRGITDWTLIKSEVRDALSKYIYDTTKRSPMILPVIMEV